MIVCSPVSAKSTRNRNPRRNQEETTAADSEPIGRAPSAIARRSDNDRLDRLPSRVKDLTRVDNARGPPQVYGVDDIKTFQRAVQGIIIQNINSHSFLSQTHHQRPLHIDQATHI
jgi:hypothetical protein